MSWVYDESIDYQELGAPYSYFVWNADVYAAKGGIFTSTCPGHRCQYDPPYEDFDDDRCVDLDGLGNVQVWAYVFDTINDVYLSGGQIRFRVDSIGTSCANAPEGPAGQNIFIAVEILMNFGTVFSFPLVIGYLAFSHITTSVSVDDLISLGESFAEVWDGAGTRPGDNCWNGNHLHQGWIRNQPKTSIVTCNANYIEYPNPGYSTATQGISYLGSLTPEGAD